MIAKQSAKGCHGIWPVMITPFKPDGQIDFDGYRKLLTWYIEHGVHGIFAVCMASEMYALSDTERVELAKVAVEMCDGKIPVAATSCHADEDPAKDIDLIKRYEDSGVAVSVLTVPQSCRDENALKIYYQQIMAGTTAALGLYECPVPPPKRLLSPSLTGWLAQTGHFKAFKETSCDYATLKEKINACKATDLAILQANTALMIDAFKMGAPGIMGPLNNIAPDLSVKVYDAYLAGEDVSEMHMLLCAMNYFINIEYITSMKYLIAMQGMDILPITRDGKAYSPHLQLQADYGWRYILERKDELMATPAAK